MYTLTRECFASMSVGAFENGSLGVEGGAYSGMVRMSNCDTNDRVMLR